MMVYGLIFCYSYWIPILLELNITPVYLKNCDNP
jgi:hypothetical protein